MSDGVGIAIHHKERVLAARDDEVRGVIARPRGLGKKIWIRLLLLEVFNAPRTPQRLDVRFWESGLAQAQQPCRSRRALQQHVTMPLAVHCNRSFDSSRNRAAKIFSPNE